LTLSHLSKGRLIADRCSGSRRIFRGTGWEPMLLKLPTSCSTRRLENDHEHAYSITILRIWKISNKAAISSPSSSETIQ
jgi:hypothetical protein